MYSKAIRSSIRAGSMRRLVSLCLIASFALSTLTGCSRQFWREQAERDTYQAISERQGDRRWQLPRTSITPDPRSRFYDPNDPDCGPLPPDDPAAHQYMHMVNGKRGYKSWHKLGTSMAIENPHWLTPFGIQMTESGDPVAIHNQVVLEKLKLQDALELSYIHSRDYQTQIENQYLSALSLTLQRFQFDVRYLGTSGRRPGVGGVFSQNDRFTGNSNFGIRQFLPSGAQWAVELTNSIFLTLGSGGAQTSASALSWSLTQPLLAGAGRKINLEALTLAERDVLYSTRSLARFRKTFFAETTIAYLNVLLQRQVILNQIGNIQRLEQQLATQIALDDRPQKSLTQTLFDGEQFPKDIMMAEIPELLKGQVRFNRSKIAWRRREGVPAMTREEEAALIGMSDNPLWRREAKELASRTRVEVISLTLLQLRTRLNNSLNGLEGAKRRIQDQLDSFKTQLGLPPDVQMSIDDRLLSRFQLISQELIDTEARLIGLRYETSSLDDGEVIDYGGIKKFVAEMSQLLKKLDGPVVDDIEGGFERVSDLIDATKDDLSATEDGQRELVNAGERDRLREDLRKDRQLLVSSQDDLEGLTIRLNSLTAMTDYDSAAEVLKDRGGSAERIKTEQLPREWRRNTRKQDTDNDNVLSQDEFLAVLIKEARELREDLESRAQSLQVLQIGPNVDLIGSNRFVLPGEDAPPTIEEAVRQGLENRVDLMNARARVMDARRAVEIAANDLEAVLDLTLEGSANPREGASNHAIGLEFTAPVDQVQQRNAYNRAQVLYQQVRREYSRQEDAVKTAIRLRWRQLRVLKTQLEINRQTIRNAALEYDRVAKPDPTQTGGRSNSLNLLNALDSVLNAQNSFVANWFSYEINRINIFTDMGIMDVDQRGVWTDNFYQQFGTVDGDQSVDELPSTDSAPFPPLEIQSPTTTEPVEPPSLELEPLDDVPAPPADTNDLQSSKRRTQEFNVYPVSKSDAAPAWNIDYRDDPRIAARRSRSRDVRTVTTVESDVAGRKEETGLFEVYSGAGKEGSVPDHRD